MVTELLDKYIWLVQTISRTGVHGITLAQLQDKWDAKYNEDYARRTFNNHREAVLEVFGIDIRCNRSTNTYYIDSNGNGELGGDASWLIDTFTVNQMLSQSKSKLKGRVSVEEVPSGHIFLTPLMDAMIENKTIRITYKKYNSTGTSAYTLNPFAVKEFEKRWYLLGESLEKDGVKMKKGSMRVFGLDRIQSITETGKTFQMKRDFEVDEVFATSFGIYLPKEKARTVRFRTSREEAEYIRDLPLHKSQTIVSEDKDHVTFEIFAVPDRNMLMAFCKYGSNIEVLEPEETVKELKEEIARMYRIYNKQQ